MKKYLKFYIIFLTYITCNLPSLCSASTGLWIREPNQFNTPRHSQAVLDTWSQEEMKKQGVFLYTERMVKCEQQSCTLREIDLEEINNALAKGEHLEDKNGLGDLDLVGSYLDWPGEYDRAIETDKHFHGCQLIGKKTHPSYIDGIKGITVLVDLLDSSKIVPFGRMDTLDTVYKSTWEGHSQDKEGYLIPIYISGLALRGFAYNPNYFDPYKEKEVMEVLINIPYADALKLDKESDNMHCAEEIVFYNLITFEDEMKEFEKQFKKQNDVPSQQDINRTQDTAQAFDKEEL